MKSIAIADYLLDRQISPQWRGPLTALAAEFESQISTEELRQLMHKIGSRFAAATPLAPCESTADLADALNVRWNESQWGYVELDDESHYLRIVHYCAPLAAFGKEALKWTPAFLEGAYQAWLGTLGAEGLSVEQATEMDERGAIEFRVARARA
jgi:hypothetical protein